MGHEYCGIVEEVGRAVRSVRPGQFVVGDGAVGLLGVLSARQMGAERIIAMSRHEKRQQLAREFGATDIVSERGGAAAAVRGGKPP
jgi:threonine dehydrogenase-like Zn-dependent dehydrogenase